MSLFHHEHPFSMNVNGEEFGVGYWPGDSKSGMVRIPPWLYSTRGIGLIRVVWRKLQLERTYLARCQLPLD
jgi:hypothetical protein